MLQTFFGCIRGRAPHYALPGHRDGCSFICWPLTALHQNPTLIAGVHRRQAQKVSVAGNERGERCRRRGGGPHLACDWYTSQGLQVQIRYYLHIISISHATKDDIVIVTPASPLIASPTAFCPLGGGRGPE